MARSFRRGRRLDGEGRTIEPTLFSYIWKYSKLDQIRLVAVTAVLFPLQYVSLEIPKQIVNRAIGSASTNVEIFGVEISQLGFLAVLCVALFATMVVQGLLKMRLNTMKGVLAERMLRRFRYLLTTRLFRFPQRYFRRTSQGEIVAMVTSESEALGGMMGDAISLPLFQGGQMLTIIAFLMVQNPWLGLAATALIPVQAWLIPNMQKKINLLARERVRQVRMFSTVIGESADGATHLRRAGGLRYWKAVLSDRLGKLYAIRFEIYQKKFFMKFVNNFITQLTPLMFFAFGGYLVIEGDLTVGALVAALAAHKDLSEPWKELLTYYNQVQETAIRYNTIRERFAPPGEMDEALFEAGYDTEMSLAGEIALDDVTVRGDDGAARLKDVTVRVPGGATIGLAIDSEETRQAIVNIMTREQSPASGRIRIAGHDLRTLPQAAIAARIGFTGSRIFVARGTFGQNSLLPVMARPGILDASTETAQDAARAGNSPDPLDVDWLTPDAARQPDAESLGDWWLDLVEAIDPGREVLAVALARRFDEDAHPGLSAKLIGVRNALAERLDAPDVADVLRCFDRDSYSDGLPIAANLFYAVPRRPVTKRELSEELGLPAVLRKLGLESELLDLSRDVIDLLQRIFGRDGVKHPLFQRIGLDAEVYERCVDLLPRLTDDGVASLSDDHKSDLLVVPFSISADQIGTSFPATLRERVVALRPQAGALLENGFTEVFSQISPDGFTSGLSVLENLIFGKLTDGAGPKSGRVREIVVDALEASGRVRDIYALLHDMPTEIGGANLTATLRETLDLTRAAIKRPDILFLDQALVSLQPEDRWRAFDRLRALLPDTTFIHLEPRIDDRSRFDACYDIRHSQLFSAMETRETEEEANPISVDLSRKIGLLEGCHVFQDLDPKQLELLAFGARWYSAKAGTVIFSLGDEPTDGAYVIAEGTADLYLPHSDGSEELFVAAEAGALIGELALLNKRRRSLSFRARTDVRALRIGAEEFLTVIEHDIGTAVKLLRVVSGYASPRLK